MTVLPWDRPGWLGSRVRELVHASLAIVPVAFWMSLSALIYTAIWTQRPTADLQLVVLGLAGLHAGRRVADKYIEARNGGGVPPAVDQKP